ncbi:hypothetical protein [Bacillus smithii]|uniref:hypothetical protein n=1 Tax=Bacillus smithii TaxID=1479 RepID=UPI0002F7372E|nr:hypothetical protein [Bacillus smithii]
MEYIEKGSKLYSKTILSLFLGSFVTFAVMYSVQPLISTFSKEFDVSPARASLSLSLTTGLLAVSMILVSALSDAVGRKKSWWPLCCFLPFVQPSQLSVKIFGFY